MFIDGVVCFDAYKLNDKPVDVLSFVIPALHVVAFTESGSSNTNKIADALRTILPSFYTSFS